MTSKTNASASTESSFNPFTAGVEFMQKFTKNIAAGASGAASSLSLPSMPKIPGMPEWALPTMDPAELEKRINELKTVLFWLEQNQNALKVTVQALEVQKMTIESLKSMTANASAMANTAKEAVKARIKK